MTTTDWSTAHQRHVEYYDEVYRAGSVEIDFGHFNNPRFGPWSSYWYINNFVERYFRDPSQRLLSLGCGTGREALRYACMGYDSYGCDLSSTAIDKARRSAAHYDLQSRCRFSVQPAEEMSYPSDYFDIVAGVDILHHVDVQRCIPEVHRILKPGGVAIFREPLATPWRDRIRNSRLVTWLIPKGTKSLRQKLTYTDKEGEHKLGKADFKILRSNFGNLTIHRWRVLALLAVLIDNRPVLERCDWLLFKLLPFVRRLGDQAVLIVSKR